jgi:diguanylate cyclase (GGDEF)-like protein/PAS domain S-box-containing protein
MDDYSGLPKNQLIEKIHELQVLLGALIAEKNEQELLDFPWMGNLGSWYWYVKTNSVVFNPQKVIALGFRKDEIPANIGYEFFTEKLHPDDYERVMENMRDHLYGRSEVYEISYRIRTRDNHYIWFYDRGKITKRDIDGKPELVSGIVFDITHQKMMEETLASQNRQLESMISTDYLTGLFNRRALFEKLDYEMRRSNRSNSPLSVIMLDIDHFKKVNDTYGHLVGDVILKQLAEIFRNSVRNTDIVARYGGEEFVIVAPACTCEDARKMAEKIREKIQDFGFETGIKATVSGGAAQYAGQGIDALIEEADKCLYSAKKAGRNRIAIPSGGECTQI